MLILIYMGFIIDLFANKIFFSMFLSFFIASTLKIFTNWIMTDKIEFEVFIRTGGMPSSHAATVISMTTGIYLLEGITSSFIIAVTFALIVISDAIGIRRSAGKQAEIINELMKDTKKRKFKSKILYEILGHTPRQVLAGSIMGIVISYLVFFL
ncbi:divergent PAP2 family protein [bacterium]|nr:divergent PAP2 family protein [bacterium]